MQRQVERWEIIVNPEASSGKAKKVWKRVKTILDVHRIPYHAHVLKSSGDATIITRALTKDLTEDCHLLVLGGDGTLNEVLNGIADFKHTVISCLRTGSGNDFARNVGIEKDCEKALDELLHHPMEAAIDYGQIRVTDKEPRRFLISAGAGYDADICYEVSRSRLKKILNRFGLGKLVYAMIGVKQIFTRNCSGATLYLDDREPMELDGLFFVVGMNHMCEGGGVPFCPQADPTDGTLDVCLVQKMSKIKLLLALVLVYFKKHILLKGIKCYRCKTMRLKANEPQQLHVDGETPYKVNEVLWVSKGKVRFMK